MESLFLIAKGFSPKAAEEWRKLRRCIPQEYRRDVEMYASLHPISGKYCGLIDQNRLAPYYLGRTIPVDTVRAVSQCIQRNGESRQVFFEESQNGIDKTAAPYFWLVNKDERADSCTFCGECNIQCPQGIDIPAEMEKVFDFFHDEEYI